MYKNLVLLLFLSLVSMLFITIPVNAASSGLVGWWKLVETSGTIAADSSSMSNDVALGGNPAWITGYINGALEFDGDGTNLGFADGHSEYWKWDGPRTIEVAEMDYNQLQGSGHLSNLAYQPDNEDLHNVQRGAWGKLVYAPRQ